MKKVTTYSQKLEHPKWQKKRLEILSRDNYTCQLCSDTETQLHVHHHEYRKGCQPWEYDNDVLVSYCKHCHLAVEYLKGYSITPLLIAKRTQHLGEHLLSIIYKEADAFHMVLMLVKDGLVTQATSYPERDIRHFGSLLDHIKTLYK